jgi:hypothetical protein
MQAVRDFEAMNGELRRLMELSKLFDCSGSIAATAGDISSMMQELVMVKDIWDVAAASLHQLQVRLHDGQPDGASDKPVAITRTCSMTFSS